MLSRCNSIELMFFFSFLVRFESLILILSCPCVPFRKLRYFSTNCFILFFWISNDAQKFWVRTKPNHCLVLSLNKLFNFFYCESNKILNFRNNHLFGWKWNHFWSDKGNKHQTIILNQYIRFAITNSIFVTEYRNSFIPFTRSFDSCSPLR